MNEHQHRSEDYRCVYSYLNRAVETPAILFLGAPPLRLRLLRSTARRLPKPFALWLLSPSPEGTGSGLFRLLTWGSENSPSGWCTLTSYNDPTAPLLSTTLPRDSPRHKS